LAGKRNPGRKTSETLLAAATGTTNPTISIHLTFKFASIILPLRNPSMTFQLDNIKALSCWYLHRVDCGIGFQVSLKFFAVDFRLVTGTSLAALSHVDELLLAVQAFNQIKRRSFHSLNWLGSLITVADKLLLGLSIAAGRLTALIADTGR
jgi:hypothetical protein